MDDNTSPSTEYVGINIRVDQGWDEGDIHTPLQVREVFMMHVMDRLSDKPDWHKKVFDDAIVDKWRREATEQNGLGLFRDIVWNSKPHWREDRDPYEEQDPNPDDPEQERASVPDIPFPRSPILSEAAFDYCIGELRKKASYFENTGIVPTFDTEGYSMAKSDQVVDSATKNSLRTVFEKLRAEQAASNSLDWHPRSNGQVLDLVHPSLYPFVYGRSGFIQKEVVGVLDAVDSWAGKAPTAPSINTSNAVNAPGFMSGSQWHSFRGLSEKYQWLPANLKFREDGTVHFSSYINNLHPGKHQDAYRVIEKLIDLAIPLWDQIFLPVDTVYGEAGKVGRQRARIAIPDHADDEDDALWEAKSDMKEYLASHPLRPSEMDMEDIVETRDDIGIVDGEEDRPVNEEEIEDWRWKQLRDAILPDVQDADGEDAAEGSQTEDKTEEKMLENLTHYRRKDQHNHKPQSYRNIDYAPKETLRERCRDQGLQVIVKMARIELTPEKPDFPMGGWHVEGMSNERIAATALYYLDSENITETHLQFRTGVDSYQDDFMYRTAQDAYNWWERVYGTHFRSPSSHDPALQYWGSMETREGRMLAFPNIFQHRVMPFSLKDKTKPGHRSFIALWLVDPDQRIVSTANVPPQQLDWWAEAAFNKTGLSTTGQMPPELLGLLREKLGKEAEKLPVGDPGASSPRLPQELVDLVAGNFQDLGVLMGRAEAEEHRVKLMGERTAASEDVNSGSGMGTYNFCEH